MTNLESWQHAGNRIAENFNFIDNDSSGTITRSELTAFSQVDNILDDQRSSAVLLSQHVQELSMLASKGCRDKYASATTALDDLDDSGISRQDLAVLNMLGNAEVVGAEIDHYSDLESIDTARRHTWADMLSLPAVGSWVLTGMAGFAFGPNAARATLPMAAAATRLHGKATAEATHQREHPIAGDFSAEFAARENMVSSWDLNIPIGTPTSSWSSKKGK